MAEPERWQCELISNIMPMQINNFPENKAARKISKVFFYPDNSLLHWKLNVFSNDEHGNNERKYVIDLNSTDKKIAAE